MGDGKQTDIIVSGHLCLDLYPSIPTVPLSALASPGKLFEADPLEMSTGGAVSNTGLALHRLGVNVKLMANVGADLLGQVIVSFLENRDPALSEFLVTMPDQATSYSILLSPENVDRIILHCTGTNEEFGADDLDDEQIKQARIFHLGYPPLLPKLIANDGAELVEIYKRVKALNVVSSLDLAMPDPNRPAGKLDWRPILKNTLPYVDIFIPSIEEILFMLRRDEYEAWGGDVYPHLNREYLHALTSEILNFGVAVTGIKLGEMGMYTHTAGAERLAKLAGLDLDIDAWADVEYWHPAFKVDVVGTTGAGDSAYAGFLSAMLKGMTPQEATRFACAVGSSNVERADSTSGVRTWDETQARIDAGWAHNNVVLPGYETSS